MLLYGMGADVEVLGNLVVDLPLRYRLECHLVALSSTGYLLRSNRS